MALLRLEKNVSLQPFQVAPSLAELYRVSWLHMDRIRDHLGDKERAGIARPFYRKLINIFHFHMLGEKVRQIPWRLILQAQQALSDGYAKQLDPDAYAVPSQIRNLFTVVVAAGRVHVHS